MSTSTQPDDSRIQELLAGKALGELSDAESRDLESLMTDDLKGDARDLEYAAAVIQVIFAGRSNENLPTDLRQRIASDAARVLGGGLVGDAVATEPRQNGAETWRSQASSGRSVGKREIVAWLALAGTVLLAVGIWAAGQQGASPASDRVARAGLIDQATDLVRVSWGVGTTPFESTVEGDVVWSTSEQKGFMRFVGMPINDPTKEQYQLWIIDPQRDDEPIDGGVFDIDASGEVIVPIDAKLAVLGPAAFAITIEKPGGVVVSTQDRLPLLAAVE